MKNVLVVTSSNRLMEHQTTVAIQDLIHRGAGYCEQRETSDVSLARNLALSMALMALANSSHEVVLMIDDDMLFGFEQATALTSFVAKAKEPASACYVLADGRIAAECLGDRWLTGLGFLCLHRENLQQLSATSPRFRPYRGSGDWMWEFTRSGADREEHGELFWEPEDFRLTRRLGGVHLLPIAVGHIKKRALTPAAAKLEAFIADEQNKKRTG